MEQDLEYYTKKIYRYSSIAFEIKTLENEGKAILKDLPKSITDTLKAIK